VYDLLTILGDRVEARGHAVAVRLRVSQFVRDVLLLAHVLRDLLPIDDGTYRMSRLAHHHVDRQPDLLAQGKLCSRVNAF
jgi:hypothetical protein